MGLNPDDEKHLSSMRNILQGSEFVGRRQKGGRARLWNFAMPWLSIIVEWVIRRIRYLFLVYLLLQWPCCVYQHVFIDIRGLRPPHFFVTIPPKYDIRAESEEKRRKYETRAHAFHIFSRRTTKGILTTDKREHQTCQRCVWGYRDII